MTTTFVYALYLMAGVQAAAVSPVASVNAGVNGQPPYLLGSVTAGSYTVAQADLGTGASVGNANMGGLPENVDDWDLNTIAARTNLTGEEAKWEIRQLGGRQTWTDSNGEQPDFFLFEAGMNDNGVQVWAILAGGGLGQAITLPNGNTWGDTGLDIVGGPNNGQSIGGVCWAITDLKDASGAALTNSSVLEGIGWSSGTLDPAGFFAVADQGEANAPPEVEAGAGAGLQWPRERWVQLNGAVSDDDPNQVGQLTIKWSQDSGPGAVVLEDAGDPQTTVHLPGPGEYVLLLEAWDELGQRGWDYVTVRVWEPNCPVGDLTGDCVVDSADLAVMAGRWLAGWDAVADVAGTAGVDGADLAALSGSWGWDWRGSLRVHLSPDEAVAAGAGWRLAGGLWRQSGAWESGLLPGGYVVEYQAAPPWVAPAGQEVEVGRGASVTVNQSYGAAALPTVAINEFMAANASKGFDETGDFDDWIELYNYGAAAVNVGGMYLTDDLQDAQQWRIPETSPGLTTIAAGGYLVIWADGEPGEGVLHAAFRLGSDGGEIGLIKSDGKTMIDSVTYGGQRVDVSFGRYPDAAADVRYFVVSTPGAANSQPYEGAVADTQFSHKRGFYEAGFSATVTCGTEGAAIRYTTDGSWPSETAGQVYAGPIAVATTTVLRAIAYKAGWLRTNVDTQTYLFLNDVIHQPATIAGYPNPWSWLGGSSYAYHDYEVDPQVVNNPLYSGLMINSLRAIPTLSIVTNKEYLNEFYWGEIEKPCSVELIYPDDAGKNVQADCGVEPHSHNRLKRSLQLCFRSEYGAAEFRSSIFQDGPLHGAGADDTLDRIVLRGGNNRSWARIWNPDKTTYTEDQWYRDAQIAMSGAGSHGTFVHLYINGLYWGLYNPCERPDSWFAASYLGGDEEDWYSISHGGAHGGDATRYNYLKGALKDKDMTVAANYAEMQQYLDVGEFSDYLILAWYMGMSDWPSNNWWAANYNGDGIPGSGNVPGPVKYLAWDGEWSWNATQNNVKPGEVHGDFLNTKTGGATIPTLWHSLRRNPDFLMLFADRAYKHLFNGGALTEENSKARFVALNDFIRLAIVAESARWGDALESVGKPLRTRDVNWVYAENAILGTGMMTGNVGRLITSLRGQGYYPALDPPVFPQGGQAPAGYVLTMSNPNGVGTIYYTLDGSDPRASGTGAPAPGATAYGGGIALPHSVCVKARVYNSGTGKWSALHEAAFAMGEPASRVRVSELMYHPADPSGEYVELQNISGEAVNLNLVRFSRGIEYTFGPVVVPGGGYVAAAKDLAAFGAAYPGFGGTVVGPYGGSLDNGGEQVELVDATGRLIQGFSYEDGWYPITDGEGFSLTIRGAAGSDPNAWSRKSGWRPSTAAGGSPGADDSAGAIEPGSVVINEVLAHSHGSEPDWIELSNTTDRDIYLGGWFLSDSDADDASRKKYEIAEGTVLAAAGQPGSYAVFYQDTQFGNPADAGCRIPFGLSEGGETLYLRSGVGGELTGYAAAEDFGASESGVTLGRYVKSTADGGVNFVAMSVATPGAANAYPKVGPVTFTELMYYPGAGNTGDEFIELHNVTDEAVTLASAVSTETSPGVFITETVSWQFSDGITFVFPAGTTIGAGGYLMVAKNPGAFTSYYGSLPPGVAVLGPFAGGTSLNNGGERVQIVQPGDQEYGKARYWIREDRVTYDNDAPWPGAAGNGKSLQQATPDTVGANYSNDAANWVAGAPTPGH